MCSKVLLLKMGKFHVPVNQHKYDQTTRDLVKQGAIPSLLKDVQHSEEGVGLSVG